MASEIVHQETFVPPVSPMPELVKGDPKISFGRVVMPYFLGLKEEDYMGIDQAMINAADPIKFRPYLFPIKGEYAVDGVALSSAEYAHMIRYPRAFGKAVNNFEYERRKLDDNPERRQSAADNQEVSTLERNLPKMQGILSGILLEKGRTELLAKESKSPGYAHEHAKVMHDAAIYAHDVTFKRILEVVGREKGWTTEQADLAKRAMDVRLFFSGSNRVANWRSMLKLADQYGLRRERLFIDRIGKIERRLGDVSVRGSR